MSFLEVSGISMQEATGVVLRDISFTQLQFQKIAISGESGAGKSTLLQTIAGLVQPQTGIILFENERVVGPVDKLVPGHKGIAYLSQHYELPKFLRVEQALRYANKLGVTDANKLYELCRISPLAARRTDQLSGGEKQRIALAILLIASPKLLLLDEPFSNLDLGHKQVLKEIIQDISEELGITCLLTSHDPLDTLSWADEMLVMKEGQVVQQGTPQQLYRQPESEYVAGLLGSYNLLTPQQVGSLALGCAIPTANKKLLIRPENIKLCPTAGEGALTGIVSKRTFYGSYFELEVQLPEASLLIRTDEDNLKPGDTVYISLSSAACWYV